MPSTRLLSETPGAVRVRRYRERQRAKTLPAGTAPPAPDRASSANAAPLPPPPAPSSSGLHETQPFKGPGPDAYASSPLIGAVEDKPDTGTPFVAPAAEAAPAPVSEAEALVVAKLVRGYWTIGSTLLAAKRPQEAMALAALVGELVPGGDFAMAQRAAGDMIEESAARLAIQMNIRFKYADHAVVLGALGVATAGFVVKPAANGNGVVGGPPPGAKNANTPPAANSSSSSDDAPPAAAAAPDSDEELQL